MMTTKWNVTEVKADGELTTPVGYRESVLLREVAHTTDPPLHVFVLWQVAGRYGAKAPTIPFKIEGTFTVRIDVPNDQTFSIKELQKQLRAWWPDSGHLPDDPPVIKH